MLLPYNVDRKTRRVPVATYGLMAANIFIFLLTILIANLSLSTDREQGVKLIASLTANPDAAIQALGLGAGDEGDEENRVYSALSTPFAPWPHFALLDVGDGSRWLQKSQLNGEPAQPQGGSEQPQVTPLPGAPGSIPPAASSLFTLDKKEKQMLALMQESKGAITRDKYRDIYQIQHAYDSFVMEPHWSILNTLAYHADEKSVWMIALTAITAMFLHAGLEHIAGNMLFLWIFGRATEEFLGRKFFLSVYFLAGFAATLLQQAMTVSFDPQGMSVPNLGASGAIAGVLGLFVVRFFRTKVRIFYLWGISFILASISAVFIAWFFNIFIGDIEASLTLAYLLSLAGIIAVGKGRLWFALRIRSAYVIAVWVVLFNLAPAILQLVLGRGGGVAYWAHIGGFALGAIYAFIIGGLDEGKDEYAVEDAQEALETKSTDDALGQAGALLRKDAENIAAHEIAARAYSKRGGLEMAQHHYIKAIELSWRRGERDSATRIFQGSLEANHVLALPPTMLLNLAGHFAQNNMWNEAGALWVRLIEQFPETSEAEIAFLRSAQMWSRQFNDNQEAARQLQIFLQNYPQSTWRLQAEQALNSIQRV